MTRETIRSASVEGQKQFMRYSVEVTISSLPLGA
jgi:hypothetical protein